MQLPMDTASTTVQDETINPGDWRSRIILGRQVGEQAFDRPLPAWLETSYERLRADVMDPGYPCFFGTQAEKRGEMFYSWIDGKDISTLPQTMAMFAELANLPQYEKNNIAIFFEPDVEPLSHAAYHDAFWQTLQYLHDHDPDPAVGQQVDPSDPDWEFSFAGLQTFVVCACPSFGARHSRNLGPGMVLLFQPRAVFVDKVTNRAISTQARSEVRRRLNIWDEVPPHADLGYYGDTENREWKQYFLPDDETPNFGACPFLRRNPGLQQALAAQSHEPAAASYDAPEDAPAATLLDAIATHLARQPEQIAIRFLADGERDERTLTWRELDHRARTLAAALRERVGSGERALLMLPSGLDYATSFLACLHANVIAVPVYPPDATQAQSFERLLAILGDAGPALLLTDRAHAAAVQAFAAARSTEAADEDSGTAPETLVVDDPALVRAVTPLEARAVDPASIAFLQYTSGSTSTPKGVMVTHANLVANERAIAQSMAFTPADTMVSWLPLFHDMGLIGGLLAPLYVGFPLVLMTPQHFLEAPARWLKAVATWRGTVSGGPNFAFQLCADRVRDAQLDGLSLDSWRVAFCGAEPIRAQTLESFADRFAAHGFGANALYPCYGLAEATLLVSGSTPGAGMAVRHVDAEALAQGRLETAAEEEGLALVSCGRVAQAHRVRIVDTRTQATLDDGEIGEIWVQGPSIAAGYWNNPQASAETFWQEQENVSGHAPRWLRTGDLGCMSEGELYVTGRVKDLIIVRGQNHYPQDIEATIAARVARARKGRVSAFSVEIDGVEGIGVAAEVSRAVAKTDPAELFAEINAAVAQAHGEPVSVIALLAPGDLPRTSSGKLRRSACASAWRDCSLPTVAVYRREHDALSLARAPYRAPSGERQTRIAEAWQDVFAITPIGADDDFFALGGDSLKAARLAARLSAACGVALPVRALFTARTVAAQAAWIEAALAQPSSEAHLDEAAIDIVADATMPMPLSPAQEGLYFEWKLAPQSSAYHVSGALRVRGPLDAARLRDALLQVCAHHDALHMRFTERDGIAAQLREDAPRVRWQALDLSTRDAASRETHLQDTLIVDALAPFDLHRDALLRATLVRLDAESHVLQFTLHHIVADAWSLGLLTQALFAAYDGRTPPRADATADNYLASLQRTRGATGETQTQLDWWRSALDGDYAPALLPEGRRETLADTPSRVQAGARIERHLPSARVDQAERRARAHGVTLPMLLLASFAALLHRYGGQNAQSDLRIGVPLNVRREDEQHTFGYFINTVAVRLGVSGAQRFDALLHATRDALLDAQAHQDVPFHRVVAALKARAGNARANPFDVVFNFDQVDWQQSLHADTLQLDRFDPGPQATPFDLALNVSREARGLRFAFEYPADLFESATIDAFADALLTLVDQAANSDVREVRDFLLESPKASTQTATQTPTQTAAIEPAVPAALVAVARTATAHPDRVALECEDARLTYGELDHWSDLIAQQLRAAGATIDTNIGLCVQRTPGMIAALLGIWKAGAAFVPLDPAYPAARLQHMLDDARVRVVASDAASLAQLDPLFAHVRTLDIGASEQTARDLAHTHAAPRAFAVPHPGQLAYTIYTSGSTGTPKGVAVSHRALALHLAGFIATYHIGADDCQLQSSTINFDVALHELLPALMEGGRVVMRGSAAWDLDTLTRRLVERGVTFARLPTAYWQQWLQSPPARESLRALRQLTVGGEALPGDALARWQSGPLRGIRVDNLYGPTETTVACLHRATDAYDASQPIVQIGKPFPARSAWVADADGNAVPVGAVGELCIGGETLARGYAGRPALTAERFVPDPHGSPGARCYRSGDLCRRRADGGFDFLGRIDRQIKLRGFRIEPGEIEAALRQCEGVGEAAIEARGAAGHVRLLGWVSGPATLDLAAILDTLRARLPAHMVPAVLQRLDALPVMANGKLDRRALPDPVDTPSADDALPSAPRDAREARLLDIWRAVLGSDRVGVHDNFFEAGGDSILSLQVVARAAQAGLHFSLQTFYAQPVITSLARVASEAPHDAAPLPAESHAPLPLTPIQRAFFERFPAGESHWNQTVTLRVDGELDVARVIAALRAIIATHDALRLRFFHDAGQASPGWRQQVQAIDTVEALDTPHTLLDIADFDGDASAPHWPAALREIGTRLQASLDIGAGRLLRAAYVRLRGEGRLVLTAHHLAVDGMSWRLLFETFERAYAGNASDAKADALPWSAWVEQQQAASGTPDAAALDAAAPDAATLEAWTAMRTRADAAAARAQTAAARLVAAAEAPEAHVAPEAPARLRDTEVLAFTLPADLTARLLRDAPARARTSTEALLIAALADALRDWSGAPGAWLSLESHGRSTHDATAHDPARTVGWFTTRHPAWFDLEADALAAVKSTLRSLVARTGGLHTQHAAATPAISFNYLGRFDQSLPGSGELAGVLSFALDEDVGPAIHADSPIDYALDVNAWVANARLSVSLRHLPARLDAAAAQTLATRFEAQLGALAARCEAGDIALDAADFPLAALSQDALDALRLDPRDVRDLYPATPLQSGLLFHALDAGAGVYVNQLRLTLDGPLDRAALRAAWQSAVDRHEILRTRFALPSHGAPLQIVQHTATVPFEEIDDLADGDPARYADALDAWCEADRLRGFDFTRAPLLRLTLLRRPDGAHDLVRTIHHALLDGWSSAQLLGEIADDYAARVAGHSAHAAPTQPFRAYVEWLRAQPEPRDWWLDEFERHPEPATLLQPLLQHPSADENSAAASATYAQTLGADFAARLRETAQRQRVTVNTLAQAAWALVLARRGFGRHVAFGTTVAGRPAQLAGSQQMVGLFINSLPALIEVPAAQRTGDWLRALHARQAQRQEAGHVSLADLQRWSGRSGDALFDSLLVFENYPLDDSLRGRFGALRVSGVASVERTHYALTILMSNDREGHVSWLADGARVSAARLPALAQAWRDALDALCNGEERAVGELGLQAASFATDVTDATAARLPRIAGHAFAPIGARLAAQAVQRPAALAVSCEDEAIDYAALNAWSNRIAHRLLRHGAHAERRIGVCVARSAAMVAALYGVSKSGAAYVPLDPSHPPQRLQRILDHAGIDLIVTDAASAARLADCFAGRTLVDASDVANEVPTDLATPIAPEQAAYVIYTSGSTGEPKGVCVSHASLDRLLASLEQHLDFSARDVWLSVTTISFDIAALELHLPLTRGARVELASRDAVLDGARLLDLLAQSGATVMQATPTGWRMVLESEARAAAPLGSHLRTHESTQRLKALCGGEALSGDLATALLQRGVDLRNVYGPTETTIWSSIGRVAAGQPVTLGVALHDTALRVLDRDGAQVAPGAAGELCIGGDNLARGYLHGAALTAAAFVPDAWGAPGARLYRTGDLCRLREDGGLDYLGRIDQQLKLRGHRIEPAEIEAALRALDGVHDAAVMLRTDTGTPRLVAWLAAPGRDAQRDGASWRAQLAERLPAALVPAAWVVLDALPLTSSGKIDRRALPAPAATEADTGHTPLIEPRTPLEAQLLAIWRAVLPAQSLGVTTDFFAAGGDSILSLRVVSAARDAGLALSPRLVFQHPSVELLARVTTTLTPQAEQQPAANRELDTTIAAALTRAGIDLQTLADVYATTPLQRGLLSLGLRADVDPYHLQRVFELRGPFDTAAFHAAWRQVSARHGALRTDFFADGLDVPVQLVRREASIDFDTLDWRALGDDEARDALAAQWRATQASGFDFARASHQRVLLIERGEHCRWFVWRFHHAQLDGWSIGIVLRDLLQAYGALREARPLALQAAPAFADYVRWLDTHHDEAETLAPWRETLAASTPTPLPLARPLAHTTRIDANSRALEHTLQLSSDESAQLERFARTCGVTLNTLIQGAWIWLLSRHANQRDIALGVTVSGRSDGWAGADETAGLFINTLPLAVTLPPSMTVRAWLTDLQTRNLSLQEHAQTPLATLQRAFAGQAGTPLFESIFVFENYPLDAALRAPLAQGLAIRRVATGVDGHAHDGRNHFPLSLIAVPGEALTLTLAAQPTHYDEAAVQQLATQLRGALDAFVADPARAMGAIGDTGFAQPQTAAPKHAETNLLARVAHHAATQPRAVALLDETGPLDWGTLWSDAGALAARLTAFGIGAEDTVAVALPRSHALVVAMLAIWRAGGVYAPLDPSMPAARLAWQLRDADARCLIAADDPVWRAQDIALLKPAATHASAEPHTIDAHIALPAQRAAYLIYTSGSTGTPKGVTIPHGALAAYVAALLERLPTGIGSAGYLSTPAADLGHSTLMAALWSGWTLHLIDDARAFDADRYAQWCSEHPVDLLKISPSHLEGLLHAADARAVLPRRALLLGGEASGATLLDRLAALRPECALIGHYGPTESTVGVLTSERDASGALPLGRPLRHAHAYLLDADGAPALPGATGEIHLGGVALARGYRGRPGLTAERFVPDPRVPGARVYRTGDRARLREDGQFEFLGRVDDQLKIRGHRVEPAEVAAHLRALPGVRDAAVIGQKDAQQRLRLIGYVTGDDLDVHALHDALAQRVPAALVPSALHRLDVLPLTRNGKIDRAALAALNLSNTADFADAASHAKATEAAAPQTPTQHALLAIWRSVLRAPQLGIDDNFFMAGGDSINAFQVVAQARRQALVFSSRELFAQPTVRELCATLDAAAGEANSQVCSAVASLDAAALGALGLDPARVQDTYPATPMQQGLLFHSLAHGDRTPGDGGMYVTQRRLKLAGVLDRERLIAAWQHAVARHDILRTRFEWHGDTLLQVVDKTVDLPFATHEARTESRAEYEARLIDWMRADLARGFDAARAPLMRLDLFAAPDGAHDLVWTTHHALLDGWSAAQLLAETWTHYRSPENAVTHEASAPYRAYVDWLDAQPDAADWWREAAAHCDDPATLTACLNPPAAPQEGAFRMEAPLGAARERALRDAAAAFGVTLNTLMQGAWAVLLARLGNRDSAAFGCTVSGRPETLDGAAQMLGLFINSLPVWTPVQPDAEIGAWLRTLQSRAAAMRHYEHTPLAQLQRWVGRSGDALFDTLFVFENYPLEATLEALDDAGHAGEALRVNGVESAGRTHYPLTLMVVPQPTLRLEWEWDGLRLDREHVGRLAQAYEALLDQIASGAGASLCSLALPVLTREAVPLDGYAFEPVAERVARQLVAQPERVALRGEHAAFNAAQLQQWANSIAASVRNAGVKRDACVAVCVERSPALIAAMLGLWQAGAAYLPVDPAYPDERIAAMLDDARVTCVVADATTASRFEALNVVRADLALGMACEASFAPVHPDQLAYVIYTSGSTGKPKGVGVTHGALDRLVASIARKPGLPAEASWLSESAPVFDISLLEYCLPLVAGIPLEIVSAQTARDGFALAKRLEESGANVFQATPSGWRMLIEAGWRKDFEAAQHPPLLGISGGEALHPDLAAALIARNVTLWNIYGPTETTIYSAGAQVHADEAITHGDPLPDTVLRVIDRQGAAVPDGGLGELCIGGENLARGYLGRPGLTAERFVPDPDGAPGARIYRTGDLCRLRADGRPEPFGRLDQQIKLRGFRIEPGEIEAALCACEGVAHAAVVLRGEGARQRLAAYVSGTAQPADLRAQLTRTLPAHMVPSAIVALATLPLTPSGKLDRRALPEPAWDDDNAQAIAPRNEREQTLLDIWQSVLGHAVHSVCMNFFEAGGDSISGVRVAARINETFGRSVPLADLFAHATIRSLADLLETQDKNPQQTDADALSQLLADFE